MLFHCQIMWKETDVIQTSDLQYIPLQSPALINDVTKSYAPWVHPLSKYTY